MRRQHSAAGTDRSRGYCLTEMSVVSLVAGALGVSLVLWLLIMAVL